MAARVEHYVPELRAKSLTEGDGRGGGGGGEGVREYAGWAHNTLFVAELAQVRAKLPEELRTPPRPKTIAVKKEKEGGRTRVRTGGAGGAAEGDEGKARRRDPGAAPGVPAPAREEEETHEC